MKQILREGAAKFNENPKLGLEFLEGKGDMRKLSKIEIY
jgi:hypothetical protein